MQYASELCSDKISIFDQTWYIGSEMQCSDKKLDTGIVT